MSSDKFLKTQKIKFPEFIWHKSVQEYARDMVNSLAFALLEWKDTVLREHLYAKCDRCEAIVSLDNVRIVEDVAQLLTIDRDPSTTEITLRQRIFEVVCDTCLEHNE